EGRGTRLREDPELHREARNHRHRSPYRDGTGARRAAALGACAAAASDTAASTRRAASRSRISRRRDGTSRRLRRLATRRWPMSRTAIAKDLIVAQSRDLKMPGLRRAYEQLGRQAREEHWTHEDYLHEVLAAEQTSRHE